MTILEKITQAKEITANSKKVMKKRLTRAQKEQLRREMDVLDALMDSIAKDMIFASQSMNAVIDSVSILGDVAANYQHQIQHNSTVENLA